MSKEDHRFMVTNSAEQVNGPYQISLPSRTKELSMQNNKIVDRLHLKQSLQRDSLFHADYTALMNDLVAKGYAERVSEGELERSGVKVWHHDVYHSTKGNIRVFFDCGATFQGTLVNAQQRPDLTCSLIGV